METVNLLGIDCTLIFGFYQNNTICIEAHRLSDNEPWCTPTINWEQNFEGIDYAKAFQFPCIIIKDYSENEGVYNDLVNGGVINHGVYLSGSRGTVQAALLTDEWEKIAKKQLKL